MIESAADLAVLFDPGAFAEAATWTPQAGAPVEVRGIFTNAHTVTLGEPGVSAVAPVFTLAAPDPTPRAGDMMELRSAAWRVADVQPDGSGLTRLILERA